MNWSTVSLITLSVSMSAFAQILLKTGMRSADTVTPDAGITAALLRMPVIPWIVGGLGLYFLSAFVWLFVLARAEVSYAYPFVSFGFILTMILGSLLLGEHIGPGRFF